MIDEPDTPSRSTTPCPRCADDAALILVAPGPEGAERFQMKAYECFKCGYIFTEVVADEPQ